MLIDLLLACYLANANCAAMSIVTSLTFIILIVSWLHAFFLVVPARLSLVSELLVACGTCLSIVGGKGNSGITCEPVKKCCWAASRL